MRVAYPVSGVALCCADGGEGIMEAFLWEVVLVLRSAGLSASRRMC